MTQAFFRLPSTKSKTGLGKNGGSTEKLPCTSHILSSAASYDRIQLKNELAAEGAKVLLDLGVRLQEERADLRLSFSTPEEAWFGSPSGNQNKARYKTACLNIENLILTFQDELHDLRPDERMLSKLIDYFSQSGLENIVALATIQDYCASSPYLKIANRATLALEAIFNTLQGKFVDEKTKKIAYDGRKDLVIEELVDFLFFARCIKTNIATEKGDELGKFFFLLITNLDRTLVYDLSEREPPFMIMTRPAQHV